MAISKGSTILASDVGLTKGATATASGINSAIGTSVSAGNLIQPVTGTKYLIRNGARVSGMTYNSYGGAVYQNFTNQSDHVLLSTYQGGSNDYIGSYIGPAITFKGQWKKLIIDSNNIGDTSYIGLSTNNNSKDPSFSKSFTYFSRRESWTGRRTQTFDISSVTSGTLYVAFKLKAWASFDGSVVHGSGGQAKIYNLYLST